MEEALGDLPNGLHESYSRSLRQIPSQHRIDAVRLLRLLLYLRKPLETQQILTALTIDPDAFSRPLMDERKRMKDLRAMTPLISSFIVEVDTDNISLLHDFLRVPPKSSGQMRRKMTFLKIAHSSVRDYLVSTELESFLGTGFPGITSSTFQEIPSRVSIIGTYLAYLDA